MRIHAHAHTHRCPHTCMYAYTHEQLLGIKLIIFSHRVASYPHFGASLDLQVAVVVSSLDGLDRVK